MRRIVRLAKLLAGLLIFVALATLAYLAIAWFDRETVTITSTVLEEERRLTIYNPAPETTVPVILVLDGEKWRHGLATAAQARLLAWINGKNAPIVIAIDGMGLRNIDFRNRTSRPADWRPSLTGRADKFDLFVLDEIIPLVERRAGGPRMFYLFGHSLGGLYAVDFAIRHAAAPSFGGFAAFSPTFSHDLSILDRLAVLCASNTRGLITIGLESAREDHLFRVARERLRSTGACVEYAPKLERHPGAIHQIAMLPGQAHAIWTVVK